MDDSCDLTTAHRNPYPALFRDGAEILDEVTIDYFRAIFEESCSVFRDENAVLVDCDGDPRFPYALIGMSSEDNLLFVRHSYREEERIIELGSPRVAKNRERDVYERGPAP